MVESGELRPIQGIVVFLIFTQFFFVVLIDKGTAINRPAWLITPEEAPEGWEFSTEILINDRFYISFKNPSGDAILAIEGIQFNNSNEAELYVTNEYLEWNRSGQLEYIFHKDKVNLSFIDSGVIWEVKSPCCYSRGVVFSIDNIYVYIFGSQQSTWSEINLIYTIQLIKIFDFLNRDVPPSLYEDTKLVPSNSTDGWFIIMSLASLIVLGIFLRRKGI